MVPGRLWLLPTAWSKTNPENAGWQHNLSVSYSKIGDVLMAQGNLAEALKSYRDGLAVADRLAKSDPENADWQRDLSTFIQQDRRCAGRREAISPRR